MSYFECLVSKARILFTQKIVISLDDSWIQCWHGANNGEIGIRFPGKPAFLLQTYLKEYIAFKKIKLLTRTKEKWEGFC